MPTADQPQQDTLSQVPAQLWQTLVNWFFTYRFNNFYHTIFYKIFAVVIRSGHRVAIRNLIWKTGLLDGLVKHFKDTEPTAVRGHIILIANIVRLTCESQAPTDYLPALLASHQPWKEFLPELM